MAKNMIKELAKILRDNIPTELVLTRENFSYGQEDCYWKSIIRLRKRHNRFMKTLVEKTGWFDLICDWDFHMSVNPKPLDEPHRENLADLDSLLKNYEMLGRLGIQPANFVTYEPLYKSDWSARRKTYEYSLQRVIEARERMAKALQ